MPWVMAARAHRGFGALGKMIFVLAFFLGASGRAIADVQTIRSMSDSFKYPSCAQNGTCDLLGFNLRVEDYRVTIPSQGILAYGTRMVSSYRTSTLADLESYGIVQFIKGCVFHSEMAGG